MHNFSWSKPSLRRVVAGAAIAALSTLGAASCSDSTAPGGGDVTDVDVFAIPMSTKLTNIPRGTVIQLLGVPSTADSSFVDAPITWTTGNSARASVDAAGKVTALTCAAPPAPQACGGDVYIYAEAAGKKDSIKLNIQAPVASIVVTPTGQTIRREGGLQMTATITGLDGVVTVRPVTWLSSNTSIATVSSTGFVAGVADGTVTISATTAAESDAPAVTGGTAVIISGSPVIATVTVTPATPFNGVGQTTQMTATARAGSGTVVAATPTWASGSPAVATVSATGLVACLTAGSSTITATVNNGLGTNVSGNTTITCAATLIKGVATAVPSTPPTSISTFAYVVPAGATSLSITASGGTGDGDVYIFAPGVTPSALNTATNAPAAYTNSTAASANSGNAESINVASPAAGTWRVIIFGWGGAPTVTGMSITATHTP